MAYSVIKTEQGANGGNGYYTEYLCESVDDIATLPTEVEYGGPRPGSLALLEDGTIYILTNAREWSEFNMSGGGGSGGTGGNLVVGYELDETEQYMTLDKTAGEIIEAIRAGRTVLLILDVFEGNDPYLSQYSIFAAGGFEEDGTMYYTLQVAAPNGDADPYGSLWFLSLDDYPTTAPPDSPEPPIDEGLH